MGGAGLVIRRDGKDFLQERTDTSGGEAAHQTQEACRCDPVAKGRNVVEGMTPERASKEKIWRRLTISSNHASKLYCLFQDPRREDSGSPVHDVDRKKWGTAQKRSPAVTQADSGLRSRDLERGMLRLVSENSSCRRLCPAHVLSALFHVGCRRVLQS